MSSSIVRGKYLVVKPGHIISDGALLQRNGVVEAVGKFQEINLLGSVDEIIGGSNYIVIPGLVNAHHHGRGSAAYLDGIQDDALERWLLNLSGSSLGLDSRLGALISALMMIQSGTTTTLQNHLGPGVLQAVEGYAASGMRVAFSSAYIERSFYTYDDVSFYSSLPSELASRAKRLLPPQLPNHDDYFELVDESRSAVGVMGDKARVLISPVGVYWVADEFLIRASDEARKSNLGIHMHLLETPYQSAADQKIFKNSAVQHLNDLEILGPSLSFAHGVWLDEQDIELLAHHGCSVCHCPSSNLRLRNGRAPIVDMNTAKVPLAIGTDGLSINDDDDLFQELALSAKLHGKPFLNTKTLRDDDVFAMATTGGARLTGFDNIGTLEVGKKADVVTVDWQRKGSGYLELAIDPLSLLVNGTRGSDVHTVMIDGDVVYREGIFTHLDEKALLQEATDMLNSASPRSRESIAFVEELTPYLENFYANLLKYKK